MNHRCRPCGGGAWRCCRAGGGQRADHRTDTIIPKHILTRTSVLLPRIKAHRPRRKVPLLSDSKAEAPRDSSEMLACTEMITMCLQSAKHEHLRKQQEHEHNQNQNQGFSLVQDVSPLLHLSMWRLCFYSDCLRIQASFGNCCILQSALCEQLLLMLKHAAQLCKKGEFESISAWITELSSLWTGAHARLTSITYTADTLMRVSWCFSSSNEGRVVTSMMAQRRHWSGVGWI